MCAKADTQQNPSLADISSDQQLVLNRTSVRRHKGNLEIWVGILEKPRAVGLLPQSLMRQRARGRQRSAIRKPAMNGERAAEVLKSTQIHEPLQPVLHVLNDDGHRMITANPPCAPLPHPVAGSPLGLPPGWLRG